MQLRHFVSLVSKVPAAIQYFYIFLIFGLFGNNDTMLGIPCDKSRYLLNLTWGIVTDGPSNLNYTQDSYCEWLIKAQNQSNFITLTFKTIETECSYDYIFVYDGDNFESPLLGSFSGKSEPQTVTAISGSMLILLYSDANYALQGFLAEYSVTECPRNCTGHGVCVNRKCKCEPNWGGIDCSYELCPDNCGFKFGRGICDDIKCKCFSGYSGQACELHKNDSIGCSWFLLSHSGNGLNKRAAHTAVYVKETDSLYVFGGYDLNKILGDLLVYSFNESVWKDDSGNILADAFNDSQSRGKIFNRVTQPIYSKYKRQSEKSKYFIENLIHIIPESSTLVEDFFSLKEESLKKLDIKYQNITIRDEDDNHLNRKKVMGNSENVKYHSKPLPRYGHAASKYPGGFVIYGGKLSDGNLSDELWFYNVTSKMWSLRAEFSIIQPPKLTRHTLTLVGDNILYLFGGSTIGGEFSSRLYSIELTQDVKKEQWQYIHPRGGKDFDVRLVAHTTVYSSKIHSLIIYGGVMAGLARLSKLSDRMFLFKISSRHWSEIHYPRVHISDSYVPRERAFHTSVIIGNYLVVYGGYTHRHNKEEICYDNQMYLYHLGCHTWVSHEVLGSGDKHLAKMKRQGVFAHSADIRNGNTLLIVGGYHGSMNGDLWAYILPPTLTSREGETFEPEQFCSRHHSLLECTSNPECGWCSADEVCYGRTVGVNCTTNLQTTRCPGLCPTLGDCHSCLIHGEISASTNPAFFSVARQLRSGQCIWCVQNAKCRHKDDNYGVCGLREDSPLQIPGWWGLQGTEITSVEECRTKDHRPGLTFIKYKYPTNWSQPDSVTVINSTTIDFDVPLRDAKPENTIVKGMIIARLLGYLRIPKEWANVTETLRMCASFSTTALRLSRNSSSSQLELVGNVSTESTTCKTARWPSGSAVILRPGRFLIDFESKKSITSESKLFFLSKMFLMHNKSQDTAKIFTYEYLEPYQNGSCHLYLNCLHCLTDSLCGWCDATHNCLPRNISEPEVCNSGSDWRYLILQPSACVNCSNFISCELCVSSEMCEWWIDDAKCSRRGRSSVAVQNFSNCPIPCHLRRNCSQCLEGKGRCVWCEATKECFSFSVYTSEYQFGLCREWFDQNYSALSTVDEQKEFFKGKEQCKSCLKSTNCSTCLLTMSCGWCYEINNPIVGVCVLGDFNKPDSGHCSQIIGNTHDKFVAENETKWSYAECPDVDECDLKLDDCHPDAICTNTYGSFVCVCKRGFYGDGRRSCTKTCYNECVHGVCTMAPDYRCQCDLGWTGEDCGINCGCNNHSTCNQRVGICDQCQDWTTGDFCQFCKIGSFGNATSELKCKKCECNGHEDSSQGFCDSKTGVCFCGDNTEGDKCEKCKSGYYGNPEGGGLCYYQCVARGMMTTFESQGIGSHRSSMTPWEGRLEGMSARECLWILNFAHLANSSSRSSVIQLTIDGDISVTCQDNSVFVYEGLPDLVSLSHQNPTLGAFCRRDDMSTLTVETKSGVLTVLYKQGNVSEGFNASYNVFTCPDHCPVNHTCVQNECVCREGWIGPDCSMPVCLNNCSFHLKQGICDKGYGRCICQPGFGSSDCSAKINDQQIMFTELFNSAKLSPTYDHLRKMIPRFGHSLVTDRRGSLWMFGGYSLSHGPLNDIRLFDTKNNTWMQVTVDSTRDVSMPQGRYFHASEIVHSRREIYVFGGIGAKDGSYPGPVNSTLQDFWKFSIKHQRWSDIVTPNTPPPVAGHTLTLMKDLETEILILIGGFSPEYGFLNNIWSFNLEKEEWSILKVLGNGPHGVYGHSSVYHSPTKSFYVYGGFLFTGIQTVYSKNLYSFHYPSLTWSNLPTFEEYNPGVSNLPEPRFLHSAITTKEYMLIFGGRIFQQNTQSSQISSSLIAYSYSCNQWIRLLYRGAPIVGSTPPLTYAQSMTFDPETGAVYIVGGFNNVVHSDVIRINLPLDLCNLWSGKEQCRSFLGCSFCSVSKPDKTSKNYCYSSSKSLKESCDYYNGTLITNNGVVCDRIWFKHRTCEHFRTCSECLAKWPTYIDEEPVCKWCSNCSRERCVPFNHTCRVDGKCENVLDVSQCSKISCSVSECIKCYEMKSCFWAENSCLQKDTATGSLIPKECLFSCSSFKDCFECLSHHCRWSTTLKECISPNYQPLLCTGGICGLVLKEENIKQCPKPCNKYTQCATCLKNSHCGWCSLVDENDTGTGVCTEGTIEKPAYFELNNCKAFLPQNNILSSSNISMSWNYVTCPRENECLNEHHTCDPISEVCEDLPQGFKCVCGPGYRYSQSQCEPVCSQGCVRGKCVQPDHCVCDFGYVGVNCSIQCQCNGHSNCAGPDKLRECLQCHNNTKGLQCERCKPLFVGDPTNNGKCVPCYDYCHQHANICIDDSLSKHLFVNKSISELMLSLEHGPKSSALCVGCTNQTKGRKCDECMEGFFRGTDDLRHHCRPCECHGHGDRCDPVTGEKCNCANNTESECQTSSSKNSNQQCWMLQCSKCKESYSGTPTEGHQCYKQMTLDHKFCLNSKLIEECKMKPKPLYPGQSAFFQVQPRYVNVDIRVFVDVMQGSLDLYMSLKDDSLVVLTNSTSGQHSLEWDPKYKKRPLRFDGSDFNVSPSDMKLISENGVIRTINWSIYDPPYDEYFEMEREAEEITTYITVNQKNTFLHVKNIRGRLIMTLPKDRFDLISTRFYLGLVASTYGDAVAPTYGILFFRQDQLHIDLFVFFSVFFSCFFLFLAGCVIAWKAKQAADIRRARRRHVVEMLHMAKRPFAKVIIYLEKEEILETSSNHSQSPLKWKKNKGSLCSGEIRPVGIEPTDDGLAAIATFFVRLPGGTDAPIQLSLASSLIMLSRTYNLNSRAYLRRRSSHHGSA